MPVPMQPPGSSQPQQLCKVRRWDGAGASGGGWIVCLTPVPLPLALQAAGVVVPLAAGGGRGSGRGTRSSLPDGPPASHPTPEPLPPTASGAATVPAAWRADQVIVVVCGGPECKPRIVAAAGHRQPLSGHHLLWTPGGAPGWGGVGWSLAISGAAMRVKSGPLAGFIQPAGLVFDMPGIWEVNVKACTCLIL